MRIYQRGETWWVRYRRPDGSGIRRSLHTTDEGTARLAATAYSQFEMISKLANENHVLRELLTREIPKRGLKGTVYFVECIASKRVKVGYTGNMENRMSALKTHSPQGIRVLRTVPGGVSRERDFHERFAAQRERGEWFRNEGALAVFLAE